MKKLLAVALTLVMLIPMLLAIIPANAAGADHSASYVDMTQRFNTRVYEQGSGFVIPAAEPYTTVTKNTNASVAGGYTVLQYAGNNNYNKKDYTVSYELQLGATNEFLNMFYLYGQDWGYASASSQTNVRTLASEGKWGGIGLYMDSPAAGQTRFRVLGYNVNGFAGGSAAENHNDVSKQETERFLYGAPANAKIRIEIDFDYNSAVQVKATRLDDTSKVMDMSFNLTTAAVKGVLDSVVDPQPVAFADMSAGTAKAVESFGNLKINGGDPVSFQVGFNCKNYTAIKSGYTATTGNPASLTKPASASNTLIQYAGSHTYNKADYAFSYEAEVKPDANATVNSYIYWDEVFAYTAANNRAWSTCGQTNGLMLQTAYDSATKSLSFILFAYPETGKYTVACKIAPTSGNASNTTVLAGITANTKIRIGYDFDYTAKTLSVKVARVDDAAKFLELNYSLAGHTDALNAVTNSAGPAIATTSAETISNLMFTKEGNSKPPVTSLEQPNWAFNAELAANMTDWSIYVPKLNNFENFKVADGYFTRTGDDTKNNVEAYAVAAYQGELTSDYKLEYNMKLNAENIGNSYVYVKWDGSAHVLRGKIVNGFAARVRVADDHLVTIAMPKYLNEAYNQYVAPTLDTAGNAAEKEVGILKDAPAGAELKVTIVVVGDKVSVSAALASDPTKTTGEVIFDLSEHSNILSGCKAESKFAIMDGTCEMAKAPISIGKIKLYTTAAVSTTVATSASSATEESTTSSTTSSTTEATTTTPEETTTEATTTTAEEKSGCGSSLAVASIAVVTAVATGALVITKKRKED